MYFSLIKFTLFCKRIIFHAKCVKYVTIQLMKYAELAFRGRTPSSNDGLFTFAVPDALAISIAAGCIVRAPLQHKPELAVVAHLHDKTPLFDIENILEICTPSLLQAHSFRLAHEVARRNFVPLGRVLPLFFPLQIFAGNGKPPLVTKIALVPQKIEGRLGKKMQQVVEHLCEHGLADVSKVRAVTGATKQTLESLHERDIIQFSSTEKFSAHSPFLPSQKSISLEQESALAELRKVKRVLLFAPTGSGKSHLMRHYAAELLAQQKTTFFLVPEIGLTTELFAKCAEEFGEERVVLYHSRLSEGEKAEAFWRIRAGHAQIIVGSRAALFLPFQNLGLIVMEEEHEWTFKSDQSPRYHARDVAGMLAKLHDAQLVYATATPSMEVWYQSHTKQLAVVHLPARTPSPTLSVVDLREETAAKNKSPLSRALVYKITTALQNKEQALLFLNRRGLFRSLVCEDCGEVTRCPECHISLVSHAGKAGKEYLLCHQCGRVFGVLAACSLCGSSKLRFFGSGTAQVERLLQQVFPQKKIVRIDRDTTSAKTGFRELHDSFTSGDADILVGTQIIAKGLDFDNIGVVGVVDADAGLSIPDFRAAERTFQLLVQVAGRAGRRGQGAEVVIQTRLPDLPLWQTLIAADPEQFYLQELVVREEHFLPPISRIAKLIFIAKKKETVFAAARTLEAILQQRKKELFPDEKIQIFVAPALHPKKHGNYFANLFVISAEPELLLKAVPLPRCRIDIDPVDVVS